MANKVDDHQGKQEKLDEKSAPIDTENIEESAQSNSVSDADTAKTEAPNGSKQTKEIRDEASEAFSDLENDMSALVVDDTAPDDLSNLVVEATANDDPSGIAPPPVPDVGRAEATSAAPPIPPPTIVPTLPPPPTTAASPMRIEAVAGSVGGTIGVSGEGIGASSGNVWPEDRLPDDGLIVGEREADILRYIGKYRDKLFEEIQALHEEVPDVLHSNRDDVSFALRTLAEANDIIIEDPRQYDEALYRVAIVNQNP